MTDGKDIKNRDSSDPDGTNKNGAIRNVVDRCASNVVRDCVAKNHRACEEKSFEDKGFDSEAFRLDWIDESASQNKNLYVTAEIDRPPDKIIYFLEMSKRTSARVISIKGVPR